MFYLSLLILCMVCNLSDSAPCELTEPNCLQKTMSAAYTKFLEADSSLGMENLDPMFHEYIDGNLSILKFKLYNSTVIGFRNCKPENVKLIEEHKIHVELICPKLKQYGQYDISGRLIVLPVEGNGDYTIESNKFVLKIDAEIKSVQRDGKNYITVKNFKLEGDPLEPIRYDFTNLFNGQKELANAVLKFANENWREVSKEVQTPVLNSDVKKIIKNANKYLKHVSLEELVAL